MRDCVVSALKHGVLDFNSNWMRNAAGLLSKKESNVKVDRVGKNKTRIPSDKYKITS